MTNGETEPGDLFFRGFPRALDAMVAFSVPSGTPGTLILTQGEDETLLTLRVQAIGSGIRLRLALPIDTAPGTYSASVTLADHEFAATIEVEPFRRLMVVPSRFLFSVVPSEDDTMRI